MRMNRREYTKYYKDYVDGVSVDSIEYKVFSYDELLVFLKENYYDEEFKKFVYWTPDGFISPFGMYFLEFTTYTEGVSYLLGLSNNSKGKKTIVFCMTYENNYGPIDEVDNKVGYINTIETNYFFRKKGVLNKSFPYIKNIFKNHDLIVITPESVSGSKIMMADKLRELFASSVTVVDEEEYFGSLAKRNKW